MLDKIVLSTDRKRATMVFTDRPCFNLTSDTDVVPLLMWFLDVPGACLTLSLDGETVTGIELRTDTSDEVTMKIVLKDVA